MLAALLLFSAATSTTNVGSDAVDIVSDSMTFHPGGKTATATGHVFAKGTKFEVHCDTGDTLYEQDGGHKRVKTMQLHGHVHIRRFRDGMIADSSEATYDSAEGVVTLLGDPVVTRGSDILHGTRVRIHTADDVVQVDDPKVELVRPHKDTAHVTAEYLTITDDGRLMQFERNVRVQQPGFSSRSDKLDAVVDAATTPGTDSEIKQLVFRGHVHAERPNQVGTCGKATYDMSSTDLLMEDHPVVVQDGDTLRGQTITINNNTGIAKAFGGADVDMPPEKQK